MAKDEGGLTGTRMRRVAGGSHVPSAPPHARKSGTPDPAWAGTTAAMIRAIRGSHSRMTSPVYDIPGYEYVRELGVGGMATVYLAIQRSLERSVAIKVMRRAGADENFEKRFLLEGRTMAKLPHRNIVGVYDIVQNETINYIAMEYLGGGTLSDRLRAGLSLAEAISIVVQIAGALQFAHDAGVVHRDLKPANIMFRDAHTPVLTDFGIARQKDAAA